ncbi:MAG: response regulator [Pseudomonadota bacterium]
MPIILVIEDDPTQRLLTSTVLRSAGYEVAEAEDGASGLEMARALNPALVVCDVVMPRMNGYQFVAALKQDVTLSTIAVILLTAMTERSHMRTGMTAGADDYLSKPFRGAELRQSVATLLAKRAAQTEQYVRGFEQKMNEALEEQKKTLSLRYERRLLQELNGRWDTQDEAHSGTQDKQATVLVANVFSLIRRRIPVQQRAVATRRVYQAASDALYMFGASLLVPSGDDLLAVFPTAPDSEPPGSGLIAVRAAFALQKIVNTVFQSMVLEAIYVPEGADPASLSLALCHGQISLIRFNDPLHGGESLTLACGEAVDTCRALGEHARAAGWQVCCVEAVLAGIARAVRTGAAAVVSINAQGQGVLAQELHALAEA